MVLVYPVAFWQQQNQTPVDPYANNVVLFLKGDQSSLTTNTTTTANFTVPAVNSTVTIDVVSSAWAAADRAIRIGGGAGNYIITAVPNGTQIIIRNCGGIDNAVAGTLISSGVTMALSIIDSSIVPKNVLAFGNTQLSTGQNKYNGTSLLFDGTNDYLTLLDSKIETIQNNNYTIESWVFVASNNGTQMICSSTPAVVSRGISMKIQNGFLGFESGGGAPNLISNLTVLINQWNHLAISKSGNNYIFAVNGTTQTVSDSTIITGHNTLHIGSNARLDYPYFLNGYIDSFRLIELTARYTTNFNPETDTYLN